MIAPKNYKLTIYGTTTSIRHDQWDNLNYLLNRLMMGESVADNVFEPYGLKVTVEPAP